MSACARLNMKRLQVRSLKSPKVMGARQKIFNTHPIANCARCHVVTEGGPVGPALDTIATRKQEDYILESLVDPGATIAEGFKGQVSPMPHDGCFTDGTGVG